MAQFSIDDAIDEFTHSDIPIEHQLYGTLGCWAVQMLREGVDAICNVVSEVEQLANHVSRLADVLCWFKPVVIGVATDFGELALSMRNKYDEDHITNVVVRRYYRNMSEISQLQLEELQCMDTTQSTNTVDVPVVDNQAADTGDVRPVGQDTASGAPVNTMKGRDGGSKIQPHPMAEYVDRLDSDPIVPPVICECADPDVRRGSTDHPVWICLRCETTAEKD